MADFVTWYNTEHLHSGIRFTTPELRHNGGHAEVLRNRSSVYEEARRKNPERWSGHTRHWEPIQVVRLNPGPDVPAEIEAA